MIAWLASSFPCSPWSPWSQSLLCRKAGLQRVVAGLPGAALRKGGKNVQPGCGGEGICHNDQPTSGRLPWEDRECAGRDLWSREQCSETWPASSPSELLYPSPLSLVQSPPQKFSRASSFWLNPQPQSSWIWEVLAPTFPPTHPSSLRSAQDTTLFSVAPQFPSNSQLPRQCIRPFAVWFCSLPASPQTFLAPVLCSHSSYSGMLSLSFMPLHKLISVPRMPFYFSIHIKFPYQAVPWGSWVGDWEWKQSRKYCFSWGRCKEWKPLMALRANSGSGGSGCLECWDGPTSKSHSTRKGTVMD